MTEISPTENKKEDVLLRRIKHQVDRAGSAGISVGVLMNRLKVQDKPAIERRADYLVGKGLAKRTVTDRVYNGLPVVFYTAVKHTSGEF